MVKQLCHCCNISLMDFESFVEHILDVQHRKKASRIPKVNRSFIIKGVPMVNLHTYAILKQLCSFEIVDAEFDVSIACVVFSTRKNMLDASEAGVYVEGNKVDLIKEPDRVKEELEVYERNKMASNPKPKTPKGDRAKISQNYPKPIMTSRDTMAKTPRKDFSFEEPTKPMGTSYINERSLKYSLKKIFSWKLVEALKQKPSPNDLAEHLCHRMVEELELNPKDYLIREDIKNTLEHLVREKYPHSQAYICGSTGSGLASKNSDLDIVIDLGFNPFDDDDEERINNVKSVMKDMKILVKVNNMGHLINTMIRNWVCIFSFVHNDYNMDVDVTFRNGMPIYRAELFKFYCQLHPAVRPYLMLLFHWAKKQDVIFNKNSKHGLNSYCFTWMALFWLMMRRIPLIPCVGALQEDVDGTSESKTIIEGWKCHFSQDVDKWRVYEPDVTVWDLLLEFFTFFSKFNFYDWVICPLSGKLEPKLYMFNHKTPGHSYFLHDFHAFKIDLDVDKPLVVQDPFELHLNLSQHFLPDKLRHFEYKCHLAANSCKEIRKGTESLYDLFNFYRIDPDRSEYYFNTEKDLLNVHQLKYKCRQLLDSEFAPKLGNSYQRTSQFNQSGYQGPSQFNQSSCPEPPQFNQSSYQRPEQFNQSSYQRPEQFNQSNRFLSNFGSNKHTSFQGLPNKSQNVSTKSSTFSTQRNSRFNSILEHRTNSSANQGNATELGVQTSHNDVENAEKNNTISNVQDAIKKLSATPSVNEYIAPTTPAYEKYRLKFFFSIRRPFKINHDGNIILDPYEAGDLISDKRKTECLRDLVVFTFRKVFKCSMERVDNMYHNALAKDSDDVPSFPTYDNDLEEMDYEPSSPYADSDIPSEDSINLKRKMVSSKQFDYSKHFKSDIHSSCNVIGSYICHITKMFWDKRSIFNAMIRKTPNMSQLFYENALSKEIIERAREKDDPILYKGNGKFILTIWKESLTSNLCFYWLTFTLPPISDCNIKSFEIFTEPTFKIFENIINDTKKIANRFD